MATVTVKRIGYGQVEPNQLSAQKTGQIYASLPLDESVKVLQNGEFMYYSYADNKVTAEPTIEGQEPMLVFNEVKIYEQWLSYKDFAMIRVGDNYITSRPAVGNLTSANVDGTIYGDGALTNGINADPAHSNWQAGYRMDGIAPRLFKTNIGDIFTTNMVKEGNYKEGDKLVPALNSDSKTLVLQPGSEGNMVWVVVKAYNMADGQPAVKIQRIK